MTFIAWKEEYQTGIGEIDAQHKQLIDIINELDIARHADKTQNVVSGILSKLTDRTEKHCDFEENLLEKLSHARLEEHMARHQDFIHQIEVMQGHLVDRKPGIEDMLIMFLSSWLSRHVLVEDKDTLSTRKTGAWKEAFKAEIREIDTQHKQLIDIINELHDARRTGNSQDILHNILSKLITHATSHFKSEEALMHKLNYFNLEEHKKNHQTFKDQNKRVLWLIQDGKGLLGDNFIKRLGNGYIHHFTTDDRDAFSFKH